VRGNSPAGFGEQPRGNDPQGAPRRAADSTPTLLAAISAALPPAAPGSEHHVETDRSNGKIVRRAIWVAPATGIEFPGAAQVFRIRRDTFDHAGNRLSKEIVHGVTSLTAAQADPEMIARFVRQHWGIEVRHEVALCE